MRVGLIDVDSHNFPNLALMKISAYHKTRGDSVDWWNGLEHYDVVYKAKVFTEEYAQDEETIINADRVIQGGTGYDLKNKLPDEIEHTYPDYSLYPKFQEAYGFLTRGCPRGCKFCVVSEKEGRCSKRVADVDDFCNGQKIIKLLDPNLLACREHECLLEQLSGKGVWVDFTQGLDIRFTNRDNVSLLNRIRTKMIHFAWDNPDDDLIEYFKKFNQLTRIKDETKKKVYVLTNYDSTHEQDLYRIYTLAKLGYDPYVMIYNKPSAPQITRDLQRWCNNKIIYRVQPDFAKYDRKLG